MATMQKLRAYQGPALFSHGFRPFFLFGAIYAGAMREAGYQSVKLKVGAQAVAEDAGHVHDLGEELGDNFSLRLDANRAWGYESAAVFIRGVAEIPFAYVEEPLADPWKVPELVHEFGVPVALDESLVGMEPEDLEEHRYARAVVLKPTLLGGISRTLCMAGTRA